MGETSIASPPFQLDLLLAVNEVIAQFSNHDAFDDDDVDEKDEDQFDQITDPQIDHIGNVEDEFNKISIHYSSQKLITTNDQNQNRMEAITRCLGQKYNDFRSVLNEQKSKHFDPKTYPLRRRFSIFIDRRKQNQNDQITMFEPPDSCNKMQNDYVPEIGFEFLRTCILPRSKQKKHITATDGVCGQLITFMFNVEANDEIKCYIVWNGQTMRFHGDHIIKILPNIFVETEQSKAFKESERAKKLQDEFDQFMDDRKFARFYQALKNF